MSIKCLSQNLAVGQPNAHKNAWVGALRRSGEGRSIAAAFPVGSPPQLGSSPVLHPRRLLSEANA